MKPPNSPEGVLVRIKNQLCIKLELTPTRLKLLVDKFVRENMQTSGSKTHYTRVNTYNEFTTGRMTIKVFFKFLRIIDIQSVEFSVKVRTRMNKEVTATEEIKLTRGAPSEQELEIDKED